MPPSAFRRHPVYRQPSEERLAGPPCHGRPSPACPDERPAM